MTISMRVKLKDLETGHFKVGLRFYADRSRNYRVRLGMAKLLRQMEKKTEEPFKEYQDLLRTFGTRMPDGGTAILTASLSEEKAKECDGLLKAWREQTIELESDLFVDGKLPITLPKEVLDEIPARCLEDLLDYVELKETTETDSEKIKRLEAELAEARNASGKSESKPA